MLAALLTQTCPSPWMHRPPVSGVSGKDQAGEPHSSAELRRVAVDVDAVCLAVDSKGECHGTVSSTSSRHGQSAERDAALRGRTSRVAIDLEHGLGKGVRGFLWQVVPYAALDRPVRVFPENFLV